jgi:hypothetical protein
MLKITDADNFRRTLAGLCMILAPLTLGASDLIRLSVEAGDPGVREQLDLIAASPGAWQVASIANMLGIILFVPAVLGLLHLLHDRGVVLGHVGGGLYLIGLLGLAAHNAGYYGTLGAASTPGLVQDQMVRFIHAGAALPADAVWVVMFLAGLLVGPLLLSVGLLWARVVPRWTAALLLLSWGVTLFAGGGLLVPIISTTLGSIGLGAIGVLVLRQSDSAWAEHAALTGELRVVQPESPAAGQQT